ncbi:MAG TPA: sugar transferase [Longimicrobiales bacterium]|nr:sugar transferase [Longimicrobiales bacterium]
MRSAQAAAARAPRIVAEAYPLPEVVRQICADEDWEAHLPLRARTAGWRVQQAVKRGVDIVASAAGLLVLAPVLLAIAALVWASSPGPMLYEWRVLGRRGRPFIGHKFRTMVADADALKRTIQHRNEMTGPAFKMRDDPRVTRIGRILRKYSLDELPQLWSVLKGDMSLVGPRPPSAEEFVHFAPWQRGKLAVTPGITCLWQVSGRSDIRDFDEWMRLDRRYVQEWTLWLDARILARTLPAVIRGDGAY